MGANSRVFLSSAFRSFRLLDFDQRRLDRQVDNWIQSRT
jgi:hypothetical protein